jgi:hypothetical protein
MFQPTEANVLCSNLSTAATCEHIDSASSPTHLQSIRGGGKTKELSKDSTDTLGPTVPEDSGAGAASPEEALPGTSMLSLELTKSCTKPPLFPCLSPIIAGTKEVVPQIKVGLNPHIGLA